MGFIFNSLFKNDSLENQIIFRANQEELKELNIYFNDEINKGKTTQEIINKLYSLGWTKKEITLALPDGIRDYYKERNTNIGKYVGIIILAYFLLRLITINNDLGWFNFLVGLTESIIFIYFIFKIIKLLPQQSYISIMERRAILFFNRIKNKYQVKKFDNAEVSFSNVKNRNSKKIFIPHKEMSRFRAYGGDGEYKNKKYNVFVAKKYTKTTQSTEIYKYYIFYEFEIKQVPFHYALVVEDYYNIQSRRLQNRNLSKSDFKDMDFSAREFNNNWRLRGSDKKMAYQVFGPHMMSLILKINTKDFIGLEISDSSVILSNKFTGHAVSRVEHDFELLYEIAKQVERNYREVKW